MLANSTRFACSALLVSAQARLGWPWVCGQHLCSAAYRRRHQQYRQGPAAAGPSYSWQAVLPPAAAAGNCCFACPPHSLCHGPNPLSHPLPLSAPPSLCLLQVAPRCAAASSRRSTRALAHKLRSSCRCTGCRGGWGCGGLRGRARWGTRAGQLPEHAQYLLPGSIPFKLQQALTKCELPGGCLRWS